EAKEQLAEAIANIASLKEELAEATAEVTDGDRYAELVSDIISLTPAGRASLAEAVPGWTYEEEPEPVAEAKVAEVAVATPPARRFRFVVKAK
ncbi:MAG: hypothetical protein Q8O55_03675, partial [Dehalococcoidales bacterium]|nr:hypothetical protein [Dehalococcoidales bacterium]